MIKTIQKNMNKKGFTLVELIIVIAVMAILAAIVIPRMGGITESFRTNADERTAEMYARQMQVRVQLGDFDINSGAAAPATGDIARTNLTEVHLNDDVDGNGSTTGNVPVGQSGSAFQISTDVSADELTIHCGTTAVTVDARVIND